ILLSCDEVTLPLIRDQMPKHLAEKIVDHMRLEAHATAADVLKQSLEAMQRLNTRTDREKVEAAIRAYRAGGLGVVGPEDTLSACAALDSSHVNRAQRAACASCSGKPRRRIRWCR